MNRVWHNGALVKGRLQISPFDRGLTLGDGVFETLAVTDDVALWRYEHLQRMQNAAERLGIGWPDDAIEDCIDALTSRVKGSHVLRLTLTRGEADRGLADSGVLPTLFGTLMPFDLKMRFKPVSLVSVSVRKSRDLKTSSYVENIVAAREAVALDAEDAVMLDTRGDVASSSIGNLFFEIGDALVTPRLNGAVLPGIMRREIIRLAKFADVKVQERKVTVADMRMASAAYVSNSLRFLRPVSKLDGRRLKSGKLFAALKRGLINVETEQMSLS